MKEYEKLEQQIQQQYESCTLCPRECRRNRNNGEIGFCKVSSNLKGARASLHMWEEPCISGEEGSGTVFFSGCNLGCVYCQNYNIAKGITGKEITTHRLSNIFLELQEKGANNINLVTPTHYLYHIKEAVLQAKKKGLHIPIVYNTSGYEKVESLKLLDGIVDIYLTDFKYLDGDIAKKYSRAEDYPEVAKNHNMLSTYEWGDMRGYDLCLNTSSVNIKGMIPSLSEYCKKWFEHHPSMKG